VMAGVTFLPTRFCACSSSAARAARDFPASPSEDGGLEELVEILLARRQLSFQIGDLLLGIGDLPIPIG